MPADKIKRIRELPTIPEVLRRLFEVVQDDDSTFHDIAEVIRHDQSITERILRIANASYFGHSGKVKTIEQAVMLLGQELVKGIALGAVAFHVSNERTRETLRRLWRHCCEVSAISARLAMREQDGDGAVAFVAGLLHDIGRVVLLTVEQDQYIRMLQKGCSPEDEEAAFGINHARAGEIFLRDARLPEEIKVSVSGHHNIEMLQGIPAVVSLGEALAGSLFPKPECDGKWDESFWPKLVKYGLNKDNLEEFTLVCKKDIDAFEMILG